MKTFRLTALAALCGLVIGAPLSAVAVPLEIYTGPTITDTLKNNQFACLNVGDAISCSAGMLNAVTGRNPTNQSDATNLNKWGYVLASPQGALKDRIVMSTGGNAATDNGDIDPTAPPTPPGSRIEDAYKSNNAGFQYFATGKTGSTGNGLSNAMEDPANNALPDAWDKKGTWDVSIDWLINALTIDTVRRELMIAFDYNQTKSATSSLNYWSLITVLDYADESSGAILREKSFEIKATQAPLPPTPTVNIDAVTNFVSLKAFDEKPDATDFGTVQVKTCYLLDGSGAVVDARPIASGQCSQFGPSYQTVNNAQGDSSTEILAFLPELNANLETYKSQGYDAISVRFLFGCFGGTDTATGQGYLNSGETTQCDGGGNVDVYLLANVPQDTPPPPVPEPASLALVALALTGLGLATRRRRQA